MKHYSDVTWFSWGLITIKERSTRTEILSKYVLMEIWRFSSLFTFIPFWFFWQGSKIWDVSLFLDLEFFLQIPFISFSFISFIHWLRSFIVFFSSLSSLDGEKKIWPASALFSMNLHIHTNIHDSLNISLSSAVNHWSQDWVCSPKRTSCLRFTKLLLPDLLSSR